MKKQCLLLAVVSFLAFASLASGQTVSSKDFGQSTLFVEQNWTIPFGPNPPSYFDLEVFGFQNQYFQNASEASGNSLAYSVTQDKWGNELLDFHLQPTGPSETIVLDSVVNVDYSSANPGDAAPDPAYSDATGLTAYDPQMYSQAQSVVAGQPDDFAKLVAITSFVHNWVTYAGFGYNPNINNATFVYYSRVGFCGDYSHLEIALLKAVGIPARFVAGLVCSGNCTQPDSTGLEWGAHGWVEAYVNGEWVPADPTFGEVGVLDATHAKFYNGPDQSEFQEQFSAPANYPIQQLINGIQRTTSVSVDSWSLAQPPAALQLIITNQTVGPNSVEQVVAQVTNTQQNEAAVPLSLLVPPELTLQTPHDTILYLAAGQQENFTWVAVTPDNLTTNALTIFPIGLQTLGETIWQNLTTSTNGQSSSGSMITIQGFTTQLVGGGLELDYTLLNQGNRDADASMQLNISGQSMEKQATIPAGAQYGLEFSLPSQAVVNQTVLNGTLQVITGNQQVTEPFTVSISGGQQEGLPNTTQIEQQASSSLSGLGLGLDPSQIAPLLAGAIIIILALALLLFKKG